MKNIPLGKTKDDIDAKDFLVKMIEQTPAGQTVGQMRPRLKLLGKMKAANGAVDLEDAECELLLGILDSRNDFVITLQGIVDIYDNVKNAKAPD